MGDEPAWLPTFDDEELFDLYCESVERDKAADALAAKDEHESSLLKDSNSDDTSEAADVTDEGPAKKKAKQENHIQKVQPIYKVSKIKRTFDKGDRVFANWEHDFDGKYWYPGEVESYRVIGNHQIYGLIRSYSINFDDGSVDTNIPEHKISRIADYELWTKTFNRQWKTQGVIHVLDEESEDLYAKHQGYYKTKFTGEAMFSSLADALLVCQQATTDEELNVDYGSLKKVINEYRKSNHQKNNK